MASKTFDTIATYKKGFHNDHAASKMIYNSFGKTDIDVSAIGFGGSALALCCNTSNEQEGIEAVVNAVKSGINFIDTAPYYGQGKAEIVLGKALKLLSRDTYYLATKVGRYGPDTANMFDFSASRTFKSVEESLDRLQVDSVDLLQVHDIEFAPSVEIILHETLPVLQKMKDSGKTKYIGITGYSISKLKEVLEKSPIKIDAVLSYCRCTLFDNTLETYIPYFKEKNVAIINAAALGMGLLTDHGPPDWHPAGLETKAKCLDAVKYCKERKINISKLAASHVFTRSAIDIHLIGMKNKLELEVNLNSLVTSCTDEELKVKDEILSKIFKGESYHWENKEVVQFWQEMEYLKS